MVSRTCASCSTTAQSSTLRTLPGVSRILNLSFPVYVWKVATQVSWNVCMILTTLCILCSWASFQKTHKHIVDGVVALAQRIKADAELTSLIIKKFSIKCTTGYSINALVGMCVREASDRGLNFVCLRIMYALRGAVVLALLSRHVLRLCKLFLILFLSLCVSFLDIRLQ